MEGNFQNTAIKNGNILIVEDDDGLRKKFKKFLEKEKFYVAEASDALQVHEALMKDGGILNLVLLDINIDEIDGRDIFDLIEEFAPNMKIIVSSVLPIQEQKLRIPHANDYFNKADDTALLLEKINKII